MKTKIKINDVISVINAGHTYSTHMLAAKKMNADYDPEEYRQLYLRDRGTNIPSYRSTEPYKWRWQQTPKTGDICVVLNEWSDHFLIERLTDGAQFVFAPIGCRFVRKNMFLEEDLFEL